jgi:hypothetical protein
MFGNPAHRIIDVNKLRHFMQVCGIV